MIQQSAFFKIVFCILKRSFNLLNSVTFGPMSFTRFKRSTRKQTSQDTGYRGIVLLAGAGTCNCR